jgi:dUTP pyrophosphatase
MKQLKIHLLDNGQHSQHQRPLLPAFATKGSACFDIAASLASDGGFVMGYDNLNNKLNISVDAQSMITIPPKTRVLIPTGLILDIPEGHHVKLHVRSGTSLKKGLILTNGTGMIDSDYIDPLFVSLTNITDATVTIEHGERVAQGELVENVLYEIVELADRPSSKSERSGGFGSTGTK